jgi:hypothetical protein
MILGGIATLVSVGLPWLSVGFASVSGLQLAQLAGLSPSAGSVVAVVYGVAAIGVIGIVSGFLVGSNSGLAGMARLVAAVAAGIGLAYGGFTVVDLVNKSNGISNSFGGSYSINVLQYLGFGIWVGFIGGVAIIIGSLMGGPTRQAPPSQNW